VHFVVIFAAVGLCIYKNLYSSWNQIAILQEPGVPQKRNLKDQNVLISEGELVERDLQTRTRLQSVVLMHVLI